MDIYEAIRNAVIARQREKALELTRRVVEQGFDPLSAIEQGFRMGMETIGEKFETLEIFIPDMIEAADIMNEGLSILRPALQAKGKGESEGKIILGTIQGDVHEIGKNIVKILLDGAGFEVIDLGRDCGCYDLCGPFSGTKTTYNRYISTYDQHHGEYTQSNRSPERYGSQR